MSLEVLKGGLGVMSRVARDRMIPANLHGLPPPYVERLPEHRLKPPLHTVGSPSCKFEYLPALGIQRKRPGRDSRDPLTFDDVSDPDRLSFPISHDSCYYSGTNCIMMFSRYRSVLCLA